MVYLDKFTLPTIEDEEKIIQGQRYVDNRYPCDIFTAKDLRSVDFSTITIFYGGNGSGKTTLLNLISEKLHLRRIAPFNGSDLFARYLMDCHYSTAYDEDDDKVNIPLDSSIITSDDIFDYMLAIRTNDMQFIEDREIVASEYKKMKYGETIQMKSLDDYEKVREQVLARKKSISRRKYIKNTLGMRHTFSSNGETAKEYFNKKLIENNLYCLDEPENSMSPKLQLELAKVLEEMARYCGCQFIIATHSPFLLALNNAKIYNLDDTPVSICKWWELENTKTYFDFFYKHKDYFLK